MCGGGGGEDAAGMSAAERRQEAARNKAVERRLVEEEAADSAVLKLLLLGTGESGKSTLFKQLQQLYGEGFSDEARLSYVPIIYTNIILAMKTLAKQAQTLPEELGTRPAGALAGSVAFVEELRADAEVTPEVADHVAALWADEGVRRTFKLRSRFQLNDQCRYFFEKVGETAAPDYLPTMQDVVSCRARTTGIVETRFMLSENQFLMVDVGGQRNERKKWIHCFEGVTAVIFVAAINEYDQTLYEDGRTNRVEEALNLFSEICNSKWFRDTAMILFLNKRDLFVEKLLDGVPLRGQSPIFDMYEGGADVACAVDFMGDLFSGVNSYPDTRDVYLHCVTATDADNIELTFKSVKDTILRARLRDCGLMD